MEGGAIYGEEDEPDYLVNTGGDISIYHEYA